MGSQQDLYAANLVQHLGYPLLSPGPSDARYETQGLRIGDVGYINGEGEFNTLLNICLPLPENLRKCGFPEHDPIHIGYPYRRAYALSPGHMFMTGLSREVEVSSSEVAYEFTANSDSGAVLILPSGATLLDLPSDKPYLGFFRKAAMEHARAWCKCSGHDALYLITSLYKTRDFTLASFGTGRLHEKILVEPDNGTFKWTCPFTVSSRSSPPDNKYENQTVLFRGIQMTLRWGWLAVVEQAVRSESHIDRRSTSLVPILTAMLRALSGMAPTRPWQTTIRHIPCLPRRSSHPPDSVSRDIVDKVRPIDQEWCDV